VDFLIKPSIPKKTWIGFLEEKSDKATSFELLSYFPNLGLRDTVEVAPCYPLRLFRKDEETD
jgi:hypothetical protein